MQLAGRALQKLKLLERLGPEKVEPVVLPTRSKPTNHEPHEKARNKPRQDGRRAAASAPARSSPKTAQLGRKATGLGAKARAKRIGSEHFAD
jgi:hypothetical protein